MIKNHKNDDHSELESMINERLKAWSSSSNTLSTSRIRRGSSVSSFQFNLVDIVPKEWSRIKLWYRISGETVIESKIQLTRDWICPHTRACHDSFESMIMTIGPARCVLPMLTKMGNRIGWICSNLPLHIHSSVI